MPNWLFKPRGTEFGTLARRGEFDSRGINKEAVYIQAMGRAKSWGNRSQKDGCCGTLFVSPKGVLYPCECRQQSIGTVDDPHSLVSDHFSSGYCVLSKEYKTEILPQIAEHKAWVIAHVSQKRGEPVPV